MRPRLSRHAIDEARHRGIPLELLEEILDSPEQLVQLNAVTSVYQSRVTDNAGRTYLIRAIVLTEIASWGRRDGVSYDQDRQVLAATMKVTYVPDVDVLRIILSDSV